ncbi:MAG TPA: IclR family transcriptional regulator C-terminal domain-containing protein [Armatimonadota bacterium]|jgi:DNA-binding IclR family transcriptional regulator
MENQSSVKSVVKAMALLDRIALDDVSHKGVTLASLAQELGLPQNTAHNLLKSLVASGYVAQQGRGIYVAGPKCAQIGRVTQCADPRTYQRVMASLHKFVDAEGEACVCSTLINGERVTVAVVDSTHTVSVSHALVDGEPFWAKSTGRMLAASAGEAELQQVIARQGMPGRHWNDIGDEAGLRAALSETRSQGFSLLHDERAELVAIACPITDGANPVWGTLATFAPAYRCPEKRRRQLLERLRAVAGDLCEEIAQA